MGEMSCLLLAQLSCLMEECTHTWNVQDRLPQAPTCRCIRPRNRWGVAHGMRCKPLARVRSGRDAGGCDGGGGCGGERADPGGRGHGPAAPAAGPGGPRAAMPPALPAGLPSRCVGPLLRVGRAPLTRRWVAALHCTCTVPQNQCVTGSVMHLIDLMAAHASVSDAGLSNTIHPVVSGLKSQRIGRFKD